MLTRELALRIGLAARSLDLKPRLLVAGLQEALGLPFSAEKFRRLDETALQQACGLALRRHSRALLSQALSQLQGLSLEPVLDDAGGADWELDDFPMPPCRADGLLWDIGVAVMSGDGLRIDGHFPDQGSLRVYRVTSRAVHLEGLRPLVPGLEQLSRQLSGCHVLLARALDPVACARLIRAGIYPLPRPGDPLIPEELERLRLALLSNPPPWLAKLMGQGPLERVRFQRRENGIPPRHRLLLVRA
ncbi:hypothetical protein [Azovibrio restrictus]|uniref:hypothetical protein n=1 Tax=Azovibrio restrictus TaxID=146938 RepID=UPI0026F0B037|nr:hypothetical protein [Azovibrio restrictus]MDD3484101.1 hypothetical protein [Azovibrio restrictus]